MSKLGSSIDLVIFDCDGVLVDSEIVACRIDAECLTAAGFPITPNEMLRDYAGVSVASMLAGIEQKHGKSLPLGFQTMLSARVHDAFQTALVAIAGINEVVAGLTKPICVASGSEPDRIRLSLRLTNLLHYFEPHIYSSTMVERGKPAPDLFIYAADRMGAPPERCLVVEDSMPGVTAARAANMTVFGLTAARHCPPDLADRLISAGASQVASNAGELAAMLVTAM